MDDYLRESMKKLVLRYTKLFRPMMTHEDLEPILTTLGFVGLPPAPNAAGLTCKEYMYSAAAAYRCKSAHWFAESPPRPSLPYPRIDGLHVYTYSSFIRAVNFHLRMCDVSDLFHVRGLPLRKIHDKNRKWRCTKEDDSIFVYREGTLDQTTRSLYHFDQNSEVDINSGYHEYNNAIIGDKGSRTDPSSSFVSLNDIVLGNDIF